jgi:hypothetical protein
MRKALSAWYKQAMDIADEQVQLENNTPWTISDTQETTFYPPTRQARDYTSFSGTDIRAVVEGTYVQDI